MISYLYFIPGLYFKLKDPDVLENEGFIRRGEDLDYIYYYRFDSDRKFSYPKQLISKLLRLHHIIDDNRLYVYEHPGGKEVFKINALQLDFSIYPDSVQPYFKQINSFIDKYQKLTNVIDDYTRGIKEKEEKCVDDFIIDTLCYSIETRNSVTKKIHKLVDSINSEIKDVL